MHFGKTVVLILLLSTSSALAQGAGEPCGEDIGEPFGDCPPSCDAQSGITVGCVEDSQTGPGDVQMPPIEVHPEDNGIPPGGFGGGDDGATLPAKPGVPGADGDAAGEGPGPVAAHVAPSPVAASKAIPEAPTIIVTDNNGLAVSQTVDFKENMHFFNNAVNDHGPLAGIVLWMTAVGGVPNLFPESWQPMPQAYNAYGQQYAAAGNYNYAATGFVTIRSALAWFPVGNQVPNVFVNLWIRVGSALYQIRFGSWENLNWYGEDKADVIWIDRGLDDGAAEWELIQQGADDN